MRHIKTLPGRTKVSVLFDNLERFIVWDLSSADKQRKMALSLLGKYWSCRGIRNALNSGLVTVLAKPGQFSAFA